MKQVAQLEEKEMNSEQNIKEYNKQMQMQIEQTKELRVFAQKNQEQDQQLLEKVHLLNMQTESNEKKMDQLSQKEEIQRLQATVENIQAKKERLKNITKRILEGSLTRIIAFNQQLTTVVIGSRDIELFFFKDSTFEKIQTIKDHKITAIYYLRKENKFVSGAKGEIGIWNFNNESLLFYCQQMIKTAHSDAVNKIIMNKKEDLIISCSDDCTIKFWTRNNEWELYQQINHTDKVRCIDLDESGSQLVSCGEDKQILVIQQQENQQWAVIQTVLQEIPIRSLCFAGENFLVLPQESTYLQIYQLNQINNQFEEGEQVPVGQKIEENFEQQMMFHEKKQTVSFRSYKTIILIKKKDNIFQIDKKIDICAANQYGITDDGENLVCFDDHKIELINIV